MTELIKNFLAGTLPSPISQQQLRSLLDWCRNVLLTKGKSIKSFIPDGTITVVEGHRALKEAERKLIEVGIMKRDTAYAMAGEYVAAADFIAKGTATMNRARGVKTPPTAATAAKPTAPPATVAPAANKPATATPLLDSFNAMTASDRTTFYQRNERAIRLEIHRANSPTSITPNH